MDMHMLDAVEINPPGKPQACIVWLHGLGADGHDFEPLIPQLAIVREYSVRVVLPHAPRRPVTVNGGMVMPAWYDILAPDFRYGEDADGIRQSQQQLQALIEREIAAGIAPRRIILAGFSQGGAIVLHTGLRYPQQLGGILALSAYLPLRESLATEAAAANSRVPLMMAHGTADTVVPLSLAERSRDLLCKQGYTVEWHSYPMQHALCATEIQDIRAWLVSCLSAAAG
jgi:phospholipase/carboxylesterase